MIKNFIPIIVILASTQLLAQEYSQSIGDPIADGQFRHAAGVAIDEDGNLYVGDADANRITKFNAVGEVLTVFGEPGYQPGQFNFRYIYPGVNTILPPPAFVINAQNQLMVTDVMNHRIQTFSLEGQYISTFGSWGSGDGFFNTPAGLAEDSNGDIYIADSKNYRIQKISKTGNFVRKWGTQGIGNGEFGSTGPTGIAIDADDNILVVDGSNGRIQKFDSTGMYLSEFGQPLPQTYTPPLVGYFPTDYGYLDITIDGDGFIYVTDYRQGLLHKFDSNGVPITTLTTFSWNFEDGVLQHPISLNIDASNNIFVVDGESYCTNCPDLNRVQKFNTNGTYLKTYGGPVETGGQLDNPNDMAVAENGDVYVVDTDNHRVQIFNAQGNFLSSFGEYSIDPMEYSFKSPNGISIDLGGNVYVSDSYGYRIQKFSSNGTYIRTIGEYGFDSNGKLFGVQDIENDEFANVYTVEQFANQIQKFDSTGQFLKRWSLTEIDNSFSFAQDIAVDTTNKIVYCSTLKSGFPEEYFIVKYDYEGNHLGTIDNIATLGSISVSSTGTLYIAGNSSFGPIYEYDDSGQLLDSWGGELETDENLRFHRPNSITFDESGFLYVADSWNHRVQKINVLFDENAPVISNQNFDIEENEAQNSEIGTLVATDPNNQTLTWSIIGGNEANAVSIGENTGVLFVNDSSKFDYEILQTITLDVQVSNSQSTSLAIISIAITNVNEVPEISAQQFEVEENVNNGTVVGSITAKDPESDLMEFVIASGNQLGIFSLDAETGEITVADNQLLDFETITQVTLVIEVKDLEFAAQAPVDIIINNVEETVTAISETTMEHIRVYPNPAEEYISIDAPAGNTPLTIYFTDLSGKVVERKLNSSGPIKHGLLQGTYILSILHSDGEITNHRIVVR